MVRLVALVLVTLSATSSSAQSHLGNQVGPYASLDLAGGPFPAFTPAGVDLSGSIGYRLGRGLDIAVLLGRGTTDFDDDLFPYPPETHVGLEAAFTFGREQSPWRLSAAGLASLANGSTFSFPADGSPTELSGGLAAIERRARVSVARYIRLNDGPLRLFAGAGVYGSIRVIESSTLVFEAGGPDERSVSGESRTETSTGAVLSLPVALEVGHGMALVLEPELRVDLNALFFGVGDGQVTLRLNL